MPQQINYDEIVEGLAEKTEQAKVAWEPVVNSNAFICVLDGEFTFKVTKWFEERAEADVYALSMTDKENSEIFDVSAPSYEAMGRKLAALYEVARRSALDVEKKIAAVKEILGRL